MILINKIPVFAVNGTIIRHDSDKQFLCKYGLVFADVITRDCGEVNGHWVTEFEVLPDREWRTTRHTAQAVANTEQVGGTHYKGRAIQPWDYIVANNIPFLEGSAIKHITRHREKGKKQDLEKEIHYLLPPEGDRGLLPMSEKTRGMAEEFARHVMRLSRSAHMTKVMIMLACGCRARLVVEEDEPLKYESLVAGYLRLTDKKDHRCPDKGAHAQLVAEIKERPPWQDV